MCDVPVKSCNCEALCQHIANTICGKSFITQSHLNRHKKTHRDLFVHVCDLCSVATPSDPGVTTPAMDNQPNNCEGDIATVPARFKKKTQLRQHKLDVHGIAEFKCEEGDSLAYFITCCMPFLSAAHCALASSVLHAASKLSSYCISDICYLQAWLTHLGGHYDYSVFCNDRGLRPALCLQS